MWHIEHTDTFGGEANYCWKRELDLPDNTSKTAAIRRAKAFAGFTGWCRTWVHDYGDMVEIRPTQASGVCQVVFITWRDAT